MDLLEVLVKKHSNLINHLSIEEIERQFRKCRDGRIKSRWQAIWLRMQKKTTTEVSKIVSCKPDWVRRLVRRWNIAGPDGLKDGRAANGRAPLLSTAQQSALLEALIKPAPDGGLWNSNKVAQWICEQVGRPVPSKRGWIYLKELGFTSQTPRPRHREADKLSQQQFKKNSVNSIPTLVIFARKPRLRCGRKTRHVLV